MLTCRASVPAGMLHCDFHRCKLDGCRAEKYVWETMSDYCRVRKHILIESVKSFMTLTSSRYMWHQGLHNAYTGS